jgi:YHS domain-containing protein
MKKLSSLVLIAFCFITLAKSDNSTNTPVKPYPLDHCVICGMLVKGSVGAYSFVYKGQEIKLCSQDERAEFERAPDKYLKKIAEEAAKQKK